MRPRGTKDALGFVLGSRPLTLTLPAAALCWAIVLLGPVVLAKKEVSCPDVCRCPWPQRCRAGVPLVLDGCSCCQVCAAMLNEKCGARRPCATGLRCQTSAGRDRSRGVCRARRGGSRSWSRYRSGQGGGGCRPHVTEWSPCTVTCDIGVSTRISSNNTQCRRQEESRLCQMRPCDAIDRLHPKRGGGCLKTYKEKVPRPFVYNGCTSVNEYRPKYCGMCHDRRCCVPSESRSTRVRFQCPGVESMVVTVAKVKRCACTRPQGAVASCAGPPAGSHNRTRRSLQDLAPPPLQG
ncbi:CCN family member 2-like [Rhinoraja longicauda]